VTPLYSQKLALTSPTGGGRSVGIVRSRTKATERESVLKGNAWKCIVVTDDTQAYSNQLCLHCQYCSFLSPNILVEWSAILLHTRKFQGSKL